MFKTSKLLRIVKVISVLLFFTSIGVFIYYGTFIKKIGGSVLNEGSKVVDNVYYLADESGNIKEISESLWKECRIKANIYLFFYYYQMLFLIYVWIKFLILPNIRKLFQKKF